MIVIFLRSYVHFYEKTTFEIP